MYLVDDQQLIQTLFTDRPNHPLGVGVGIWSMVGCWDNINAFRAKNYIERLRELLVVIPDQKPDAGFTICQVPHHLARLLCDPSTVRVGGTPSKMHLTTPNLDKKEHV